MRESAIPVRALLSGLLYLLLAFWSGAARAELQISIEPSAIDELDTARLIIRETGTAETRTLDLDALKQDFEILGTQTASQYRSVQGRVESSVEYQINLRPKRTGTLTVPGIQVGPERTGALALQVRPVTTDVRDNLQRTVFFENELLEDPVYVRARAVLVRRLFYTGDAQIYSELPGIPQIADARVVPLGETRSSTVIRDGQRYGQIEQRFAIFPERSGTLTIPAIALTASVRLRQDGRIRRTSLQVESPELQLRVRPIPDEYPGDQPWLPATGLEISDVWSPDQTEYRVGDPVSRELSLRVTGNFASSIPPLDPRFPEQELRQYPQPPQLRDEPRTADLAGVRTQRYDIVPQAPGTLTLPALQVTWWDLDADRIRVTEVPARRIEIQGRALPQPEPSVALPDAEAPDREPEAAAEPGPVEPDGRRILGYLLYAAVLAAGLIAFGYGWRALRRRLGTAATAGVPGLPHDTLRGLRAACRSNDPARMHQALLEFLAGHYRESPPQALARFRAAGYGELLDRLNAPLYRPAAASPAAPGDTGAAPTGAEVLAAVRALRNAEARGRDPALPELYS